MRVDEAYANLVLPHVLGRLGLEGRDAAFATELASGTLRQQGRSEAEIAEAVSRMLEGATPMSNAPQGFLGTLVTGILASAVIAIRVRAHPARTAV